MLIICDNVPKTTVKVSKNGAVVSKPPWECSKLKRKRKLKDAAWRSFDQNSTAQNLAFALQKQIEYEDKERSVMIEYENKYLKLKKAKPKLFYGYVNSKRVIKQSVVSVKDDAGKLAKSPKETAELLGTFFETTFIQEPFGPLSEECYKDIPYENCVSDFWIDASEVKK